VAKALVEQAVAPAALRARAHEPACIGFKGG
jgi:hypothetical protein